MVITDSGPLPDSYKAVVCPAPKNAWQIITVPMRPPRPSEILIKVFASGICHSDHFIHDGVWPGLQYPRISGHEIVGRIAAVGLDNLNNDQFRVGALVGVGWNGGFCRKCNYCQEGEFWACKNGDVTGFTYDGGHAEYVHVLETAIVPFPEEILQDYTYAELAPLCCAGVTVFDAIRTSKFSPGDICLVQGIGGLGHLAIQYAAKFGLKVYAVSSGSSKKDLALSMGASEYIDSSTTDVVEYMQELGGAPLIICTAPYAASISKIIHAVAKNGMITLVSGAVDEPITVWNLPLNIARATIRGYACGYSKDTEACIKFSMNKEVRAVVETFKMEEFPEAYNSVMDNEARFRNVIVFPEN